MSEKQTKRRVTFKEISSSFKIYGFIKPYKWQFIIGIICLVISTAVVSVLPIGFRQLVDAANSSAMSREMLTKLGMYLVGILLVQSVFSFFRIWLFEIVSQRSMSDIRRTLYEKIITLPISFYENNRVGELTSRISSDVTQLQDALGFNLATFVRQLVLPVVCIPFLFTISVKLTLVMVATFPPLIISAVIFGNYIRKLSKKSQDALASSTTIVEETFQAADVVKSYTNETYETNRYGKAVNHVADVALRAAKYRASFVSFIIFALIGSIVLIVWQGLSIVAAGELSMGQLIEFLLFTVFIGGSLGGLSESYSVIQKTVGAAERINEILEEQSEVHLSDETKMVTITGNVRFENIKFAYPTRKDIPIFSSLSFEVKPGEKIALVGPSGSGKSTIIKLLSRYYQPDGGNIFLDEKPLNDFNVTALRKNIGMVPQEVILFGGTIGENIAYGKPGATLQEIAEAARKANALQFIESFPEGFDTTVGERGVKLSGGQKQRIAIARAILRNPKILILDEATSALDAESEKLVKDALDELMIGRTTFIIAHRLSTIRQADKILVINKGKIAEQGTHKELATLQDGTYSRLLKLQFED
ncbi:MAG: ABC transporter transmembrane domain-containing protein [Chitinophagales bacterium]|nr:ATP-binding cassette domain-containing protein [Chitinophagales bacterium]MCO5281582.1 ABC transporter transmembrane domain-containing protein [Chitinophagales bacterium]OJV27596.1 MAG: multidrug ABC transporter ATP-binding protein [Bacteroidetes bacterium 37-13]HRP39697.1 ABC transporter transmembrane domain-containing protein [Chitinophagales bacterium]